MLIESTITQTEFDFEELMTKQLVPQIAVVLDDEVISVLQVPNDLVVALLSNPKIVAFYREEETTHVKEGITYKDGKFIFPNDWTMVDGVPTPPTIIT